MLQTDSFSVLGIASDTHRYGYCNLVWIIYFICIAFQVFISRPSEMLGSVTAHVVNHSRSNMPCNAQKGDIHRLDTMNCGISLLHYCQKPAMELLLSPPFNLSPVRGSCMLQPTLKMVLALTLLQMDFGVAHSKERLF